MVKGRLEAFSDGVFAIIITIMVLELKVPHGAEPSALRPLLPVFLSYVLSFVYVGIYWSNHHHLMHAAERVNGRVLWANLHQLFWISLFPFTTAWMGENHFATWPVALYGVVLLLAALSWPLLEREIIAVNGRASMLAVALRSRFKEWVSIALYALAVALAFVVPWVSCLLYAAVAVLWIVPDRRIEGQVR